MKRDKDIPEIRDDEIRIIGGSQSGENTRSNGGYLQPSRWQWRRG